MTYASIWRFCFIERSRLPLPLESVYFSLLVESKRLWAPSALSAFRAMRIPAITRRRTPLSVAALVRFSMFLLGSQVHFRLSRERKAMRRQMTATDTK